MDVAAAVWAATECDKHLELAALLRKHPTFEVNTAVRGVGGLTALHDACHRGHLESAKVLIVHGAAVDTDVGAQHGAPRRPTPLQLSTANDHTECAELLLRHGACSNRARRRDGDGDELEDQMASAVVWGNLNVVNMLLSSGYDTLTTDPRGRTALELAEAYGEPAIAKVLATTLDWPALKIAVANRHPDVARTALRLGHVDTAGCAVADLLAVATSSSPLGPACAAALVCQRTVAMVHEVLAPWSPGTHRLFHREFRNRIRTVLLVGNRLSADTDTRRSIRNGALVPLPWFIVRLVCTFLLRRDWDAALNYC